MIRSKRKEGKLTVRRQDSLSTHHCFQDSLLFFFIGCNVLSLINDILDLPEIKHDEHDVHSKQNYFTLVHSI